MARDPLPLSDFAPRSGSSSSKPPAPAPTNGHGPKRNKGTTQKRTLVDMADSDDEPSYSTPSTFFRPGGPSMNGHSTPNGQSKSSRKKARHSQTTSAAASASNATGANAGGSNYAELQEQRKQLPIYAGMFR
jgi:hypothetical protein